MYRWFNPDARFGDIPDYEAPEVHLPKEVLKEMPHLAPPTLRSQVVNSDLIRRWNNLRVSDYYVQMLSMGSLARWLHLYRSHRSPPQYAQTLLALYRTSATSPTARRCARL